MFANKKNRAPNKLNQSPLRRLAMMKKMAEMINNVQPHNWNIRALRSLTSVGDAIS